ncbi:MAG: PAS domain S-box protein [Rhodocyclaceae bacterium]|nr:PAS domain S-box protein [Rhodocyclaceae bacterium]
MKRFSNWPLRRQFNLVLAALTLPLAVLLAFFTYHGAVERYEEAAAQLLIRAQTAGAEAERFLGETESLLAALSARAGGSGQRGCDPAYDTFRAQNRAYANLLQVDVAGFIRCSAILLSGTAPARMGPMYLIDAVRARRGLYVGRPEISFISGRWVVPIAYPLQDADGGFAGVVGVSVDLERFRPSSASVGATNLMIVDGGGLVLASSERAVLQTGAHHDTRLVAALAAAESRPAVLLEGETPRLHAIAPVRGTGWYAVAEADYGPLRAEFWRQGLIFGALSLMGILSGVWLGRRVEEAIVKPIDALASSVKTIATGGPQARIVPGGAEEIATVAEEFNRMLDVLDEETRRAGRSEQELASVLASVESAIYALSGDGATLHYLSPRADLLFGRGARELLVDPALRHAQVVEADRPLVAAMLRQLAETNRGEAEYRSRRPDGKSCWLREQCHLLYDSDGRPWRQVGVIADVTAQRLMIEALIESENRFRVLTALSADWYWEQDENFRFTQIQGVPGSLDRVSHRNDILGKRRWEAATIGIDAAQWAAHRAQLERHEAFRNFEYGVIIKEGEAPVFVSVSGEPVFDAAGVFKGYRGVGSDITARRRMEAELRQSEARLQQVLEATSEGVWDFDIAARDTAFSPRFAELLGFADVAELKTRFTFAEALHPDDAGRVLAAQEQTLREGVRFDETYRLCRKDGGYGWFHGRGILVRDAASRPARFVGALADVTAQVAADIQLRKLSAAVEQSPVAILITDTQGNIEYANPRFCKTTGYAFDEVRGRNPRFLKSGETPSGEYRRLWEAITRGEEWSGELHNRRKNGELFWEFVRIIPLVSEKGAVTNYLAVKEDISLRKELTAREQLRQELMLHHARLAAMGEMAAALAHELNQPLAAIANFSGVVENGLAAPEPDLARVREVARTIAEQALRAGDIVWRVREFSRKQPSRREPVDLNALVGDVVRLADIAARSREVAYEYDLAPGLPPAFIDRVQIEQVLLNLIRNGVEAMEDAAGEKRLTIASRLAEGGAAVQLSVRDCGCGLPDRIAVDLFTPFFTTKPEGMGMGLSISRGIVEAHGGRLWAAPNAGAGTTFYLTLPLAAEEER